MSSLFTLTLLALLASLSHASLFSAAPTATTTYTYPLSASGSRLVDATNRTVQFRCANWPGHMETMMPEGLQHQPLAAIVKLLAQPATFNCIRLTYSVQLFTLGAALTARQSLQRLNLTTTIATFEKHNPGLIDLPLLAVRDAVVAECAKAGIMILMDNQVSESMWCCSTTDGNGWWGDRYFNVTQWLHSLHAISSHYAAIAPNAVAYSLRNELRTDKSHSAQVADWLKYVPQGCDALHKGDPNALIFVSGLSYDTDWTFLSDLAHEPASPPSATAATAAAVTAAAPYDQKEWQRVYAAYANKLTFETHIYSWSGYGTFTPNCSSILPAFDARIGYPNTAGRPHVLTEIGVSQDAYPHDRTDYLYFHCVARWVMAHRLGWGIWLHGGSYYVRSGQADVPDSFGMTDANFTRYKSQPFLQALRNATWEEAQTEAVAVGGPRGLAVLGGLGSGNGAMGGSERVGVFGLLLSVVVAVAAVL